MDRVASPETFGVIKLHNRSARCWAVVGALSGAILTEGRCLMMRLEHDEAERIAHAASEARRLAGLSSAPRLPH